MKAGDLKKGTATVGVQRQYTGTAGRIENCQVAVYLTYATGNGHALMDRALYLPRSWTEDTDRMSAAGVPEDTEFATKPALAQAMITDARAAGVPAAWVAGDEVYGGDSRLRKHLRQGGLGYVLAVAKNHRFRTPDHPDQYVVQAAIAACHALAPSYAETNWDAVISWYDVLPGLADSPVARLNRAAAVAERDGPGAGLALVDAIDGLPGYPWWHATRAELLQRLGRPAEARAAYERALALGMSDPQAGYLRDRMSQLPPP
jgi:DDE superfamily endonuclease/Tetratricopeptide repeat